MFVAVDENRLAVVRANGLWLIVAEFGTQFDVITRDRATGGFRVVRSYPTFGAAIAYATRAVSALDPNPVMTELPAQGDAPTRRQFGRR